MTSVRVFPWFVLLAVLGCGDRLKKATFKMHGSVVDAEGRPAGGAIIILQPVSLDAKDAARPSATVMEDGAYALTTYTTGDGAPAGEYAVIVIWPAARKTPFEPAGGDRLGGAMARVDPNSPHITVTREPDQLAPQITLIPQKKPH